MTINKSDKWDGIWKTRNGETVKVKEGTTEQNSQGELEQIWIGISKEGVMYEYDESGECQSIPDDSMDLMERIREGSKEYEGMSRK